MINCWLVVALPMRATGTLFCTTTVNACERSPMPVPEMAFYFSGGGVADW